MIVKITEVKEPRVGRFYLVPCVRRQQAWTGNLDWPWWPVIGPWHVDVEIGFPRPHFHHDVRFFYKWQCHHGGETNELARVHTTLGDMEPQVAWMKRKMMREMPDFPRGAPYAVDTAEKNSIVEKLEGIYAEVRMKCMTCPHRGMSLQGLPMKDGMVVCNGHGLRWNVKSGRMVAR